MNPADLETVVDSALKRLPAPRAPLTLLPRIIAAVEAWARRPWYQRVWFTWPPAAQIAAVTTLVVLGAAAVVGLSMTESATTAALSFRLAGLFTRASALAATVAEATRAARILWTALIQPCLPYVFGLVALMALAGAMLGVVLTRVAFERT